MAPNYPLEHAANFFHFNFLCRFSVASALRQKYHVVFPEKGRLECHFMQ